MHHSASQDRLVFPADVTLRLARAIAVVSCDQKQKKQICGTGQMN